MDLVLRLLMLLLIPWGWAEVTFDFQDCGIFNEELHEKFTHITDIHEHPWMARLGYETNRGIAYKCLAVLISTQYLLAPAQCFETKQLAETTIRYALLGDWNPRNAHMKPDCDDMQRCNAEPQLMEIEEIVIHPEYRTSTFSNNISILKLVRNVTFTDHIRAICLPPLGINPIGQYLSLAGFATNATIGYKLKALVHITSNSKCRRNLVDYDNLFAATPYKLKHLCGFCNLNSSLITGSALMGVHADELEPKNYYLVGLLLAMSNDMPHIYIRVQPYRKWIESNINLMDMDEGKQ
ncbi:phenoloxidase-activating factor 3 [Drosophila grimshawi]|uniref:GH14213 n=1 Tax=Drosophila grimshawi TaxID=7222 RepID=B4JY24_DROGR|nr:phenoloxidase-activating factor 3 [Drosophila grimshawi]EDV90586.1 GH14213 [Drosophila grimshawi]